MTTAMQTVGEATKLSEWTRLPDSRTQIAAAVGATMDADQFITHMLVAFQDPIVRGCSVRSQIVAFMECAALGLLPTLNQIKLIPYKDTIKAMPQWQGLKALMERHPDVLEVEPRLVHVTDQFLFTDDVVVHGRDPLADGRDFNSPKDIRGGYCKITYRNGRPPKYHVVTVKQINKCQACAQTQNVWKQWYEQMAMKTVLRDCYARRAVPVDPLVAARLERAFAIDDVDLGNDPTRRAAVNSELMARLTNGATVQRTVDEAHQPDPTADPAHDPGPADDGNQEAPPADAKAMLSNILAGYERAKSLTPQDAALAEIEAVYDAGFGPENAVAWTPDQRDIGENGRVQAKREVLGRGEQSNKKKGEKQGSLV